MSDEVKKAMQTVVDYLDDKMREAPNRQLADVTNYLAELLEKEE